MTETGCIGTKGAGPNKRVIIWSLKYQGTTYDNYLFIVIELSLATRFVTIMPVLLPLFYAQTTAKLIAKTHYGLDMHFVIQKNRVKNLRESGLRHNFFFLEKLKK